MFIIDVVSVIEVVPKTLPKKNFNVPVWWPLTIFFPANLFCVKRRKLSKIQKLDP